MGRLMTRLGLREHYVLLPMAVLVGVITAAAAVAFHAAINAIRDLLYASQSVKFLYGHGVWVLVLLPALGGLAVGLFTVYIVRAREGHGIVDVMESVMRNRGVIKPLSAIEKIITSAITIGTGGSAGAEGPIVQIGAGIASGVGLLFQVAREEMPILVACGSAAGISAIFDSPIGGVLFTLEVILLDFSIRAFAPVVLCSVIANVTMRAIFTHFLHEKAHAIFVLPAMGTSMFEMNWSTVPGLLLLGLASGVAGVSLTRLMYWTDETFHRLPIRREMRPAVGGALLGALGVVYVVVFGWIMLGQDKPFAAEHYPMPAFFGDGYGAVQPLLTGTFYTDFVQHSTKLLLLLLFLCVAKVVGTCLTLGSGGSGGIIAPSLFLGATTGALLGVMLKVLHMTHHEPGFYAIIGMGAVLAAVVHGPLSSILILFEVTGQRDIILPAMLVCVAATGTARLIFPDSVYTLTLRRRGVRVGTGADLTVLRRLTVEQLSLEPVTILRANTPLERLVELSVTTGATDFIVGDEDSEYAGMVTGDDLKNAMINREAIPLLLAGDLARGDLPCVRNADDLASVLEIFSRYEVARLPVCLTSNPKRIIGMVSRRALMNRYHDALQS
jgi:CIC family chloride channel protein